MIFYYHFILFFYLKEDTMKLFNSIRKKWLQHRISKYSLKSQDALSKSQYFLKLSKSHEALALNIERNFGIYRRDEKMEHLQTASKYAFKSEHFKHLSDFYLNKQMILEKQLRSLLGTNVVAFRKV